MCGRFPLSANASQLRQAARDEGLDDVEEVDDAAQWEGERYNIAPQTRVPVLHRSAGSSRGGSDRLAIEMMTWGLVPHWTKEPPDYASKLKTINARDDTILSGSGMWSSIRGRKRGIVLADGFYEWLKKGSDRLPHFVKRKDGHPIAMAALWDSVTYEGEAEELRTFTIVTTSSNKQLSFLHDRMPVILPDVRSMNTWLDTSSQTWTTDLANLLVPFEGKMECYPVAKEVGKVGNNSKDFVVPISERKGNLASFFAKQAASPKKPSPNKDEPSSHSKATSPKAETSSPSKRKREEDEKPARPPKKEKATPVIDLDGDDEEVEEKAKANKETMAATGKLDAFVVRNPE